MKTSISCAVIRMVKTGWRIIWMIHCSTNQCFLQNASSLYELSLHIWGATRLAWIQTTQTRQISQLAQSPVLTPLVLFCYTVLLKQYKISGIGFKSVSHFRVLDTSSAEQFCIHFLQRLFHLHCHVWDTEQYTWFHIPWHSLKSHFQKYMCVDFWGSLSTGVQGFSGQEK